MDNLSGVTQFNTSNGANAPYLQVVKKSDAQRIKSVSVPQGSKILSTDYFANSNANLSGTSNPLVSTLDDCLSRFAPKIYLSKYMNRNVLEDAVKQNPKIAEILSTKGLSPEIHMENITGKNQEHFLTTYNKAKELGSTLPLDEDSSLLQASLLHDIGKAFIPPEILNKPGKLTDEEKEIVDLHASIGAEVLKTTNLSPKIIEAVALHHTEYTNPRKQNNEAAQILSVADVYSALKEERPYKKKFSDEQVRDIMQKDPKLDPDIVNQIFFSDDLSNSYVFAS